MHLLWVRQMKASLALHCPATQFSKVGAGTTRGRFCVLISCNSATTSRTQVARHCDAHACTSHCIHSCASHSGVQLYITPTFNNLRDVADCTFCLLPPPRVGRNKPSTAQPGDRERLARLTANPHDSEVNVQVLCVHVPTTRVAGSQCTYAGGARW